MVESNDTCNDPMTGSVEMRRADMVALVAALDSPGGVILKRIIEVCRKNQTANCMGNLGCNNDEFRQAQGAYAFTQGILNLHDECAEILKTWPKEKGTTE